MTNPAPIGLSLRRMREDEWNVWNVKQAQGYVEQLVSMGGYSRADAEAKSIEDDKKLLPDGFATAGHHFYFAEIEGRTVAELWLAERDDPAADRVVWVFDIEIVPGARRLGYGRAVMLLAEQVTRDLGITQIMLNVFAGNDAAIALYTSLGYRISEVHPAGQNMTKAFSPTP